ncbi:MAG TPA: LuxR C-terminal-related transcriptional regulator, partial [Burkholderiales bacterium]|nr:LuxR C-terminal-related transcriptional regulator [Burkholderiales bacterium]
MEELSSVLCGLYGAAREVGMGEFRDVALALIQPLVAFTSATWAIGKILSHGVVHHDVHLVGEPPERLIDYEEVKHQDIAAFKIGNNPGRAFVFHAPSLYRQRRYVGIREYAKRWEHQNYVLTSRFDQDSGLLQWLGVYRGDAFDQYSERERQLLELLLPHMSEALTINRALNLKQDSPTPAHGAAMVDRFGVLHHADEKFVELLRGEWPRWGDRSLPQALVEHLGRSGDGRYLGHRIVLRGRPVRDLLLLHARPRTPVDELTPRQFAVARHIADGLPYKEIAQRLGLSPATVRNYTQAIHGRLG